MGEQIKHMQWIIVIKSIRGKFVPLGTFYSARCDEANQDKVRGGVSDLLPDQSAGQRI